MNAITKKLYLLEAVAALKAEAERQLGELERAGV